MTYITRSCRICWLLGLLITATSCSRYAVTLNEQPIYTPPPLLSEFPVNDPALKSCIKQTIIDRTVTEAEQLQILSCSHNEIRTLDGLAQFQALQQLNLSFNPITSLKPLFTLKELKRLKIEGLDKIDCREVEQLTDMGVSVSGKNACISD